MLKNSFCHLKGIGEKAEKKLWAEGIHNWDMFHASESINLSKTKKERLKEALQVSQNALENKDHAFFAAQLSSTEKWRLFHDFRDSVVYLDIETTGLEVGYAKITTCVLYDGKQIKYYVNGQNLDDLIPDLEPYSVIVTYNGKTFDIPFIEGFFKVKLPHSQIDLRYVLAQLGYKGGLKGVERRFGISRAELDGIDGYFAVLLWKEYQRGHQGALDTLLAYNCEDVLNLEYLMHQAYNLKVRTAGFEDTHTLEIPRKPVSEYRADQGLVRQMRQRYY
jgi:hypothetical protein